MRYVYEGPGPVEDGGELVHPGDVREFGGPPDWGPWRLLGEPGGIRSEADPADIPEPVPASTQAHLDKISAPASTPVTTPATPGPGTKGM